MKQIRWIYGTWAVALLALLPVACDAPMDDNTGTADDAILFYVKQQAVEGAASRAIVDDTDDLIKQELPIYVCDEQNHFPANTEVPFYGNGVWRKDGLTWQNDEYVLYAYVKSAGTGNLTISGNGQTVGIAQPAAYSDDPKAWADYLLSYRVAADGTGRPLVQLELERVTAAVELYVSFQESAAHAARVTGITFSGVQHQATMTLSRHATPSDEPMEDTGMRNVWGCQPSGVVTSYTHGTEDVPITVTGFNGTDDQKYDEKYRVMRFLTIPQNLTLANTLKIDYEVQQTENGGWETYSATFDLSQFTPRQWTIGHKTRYRLNIDISVQLEAVVEKWNTASYIEGTFLPD